MRVHELMRGSLVLTGLSVPVVFRNKVPCAGNGLNLPIQITRDIIID